MKFVAVMVALAALPLAAAETVPSAPNQPWKPSADVAARYQSSEPKTSATPAFRATVSLVDVIDYALTNNPSTRTSWLNARAAAETLAIRRSEYLPEADLNATLGASGSPSKSSLTPSLSLNYLLFDFGGREASVRGAREALIAADYTHNAVIQNVILRAEQAYFGYLANKALYDAQQTIVKEFETNLEAAEARHRAGVATIADVLQARTALSQARLNSETAEGALRAIEGALATALGIPASTHIEVGSLPADLSVENVQRDVDALLADAVRNRPDLAAARADVAQAEARIAETRAAYLPTLNVAANAGRTIRLGGDANDQNNWSAALLFRFPFFTGFRNVHDVRRAELERDIAREQSRSLEQQVYLEVWTSYYGVSTAAQRLTTSRDLLASAEESVKVARARYKEGLGSILDLLTAESARSSAVAQEIQARADWLLSLSQLAHDTGALSPDSIHAADAARGQ